MKTQNKLRNELPRLPFNYKKKQKRKKNIDLHTLRLPDPSVPCLLSAYPYKVCTAGIDKHCNAVSEGFENSEIENGRNHINTCKNRDKSNRTGFCFIFFNPVS